MCLNPYQEYLLRQISFALQELDKTHFLVEEINRDTLNNANKEILTNLIDWFPKFKEGKDLFSAQEKWLNYYKYSYDAYCAEKIAILKGEKYAKGLHLEHNPPVNYIYIKLLSLIKDDIISTHITIEETIKEVERILISTKYNNVVLTDEERDVLDGTKKRLFPLHGSQVQGKRLNDTGCYECRLKSIDVIVKSFSEWTLSETPKRRRYKARGARRTWFTGGRNSRLNVVQRMRGTWLIKKRSRYYRELMPIEKKMRICRCPEE